MRLHVVAVGRMRDTSVRAACDDYANRIRRYVRLETTEVRAAGRSDRDAERGRREEGEALLAAVPAGARAVALTRTGRALASEELARLVDRWQVEARDVALLIGGAHGLAPEVLDRADDRLSLSTLTLPHELARLVLLEQLYRACTILRGEPYHKGRP
ncbi:MAG: 23S rRNA (pseudouridine(1915)-N(3))-methyltransferase RlmH [Gemmatimonadales bacterium]|jgi:23S rRNA (pseudouridine1915-N3)-methyltransferase